MRTKVAMLLTARIAAGLTQAVMFLVLARVVEVAEFGAVSAFVGLATFLTAVSDLGVGTLLVRVRAVAPRSSMVPAILRVNLWSIAALMSGMLLIWWIAFLPLVSALSVVLIVIWVGCERSGETWSGIALADGRVMVTFALVVTRRVVPLGLMLAMLAVDVDGVLAFAIAQTAGGVVGVVLIRALVAPTIRRRPSAPAHLVLRAAAPYWLTVAAAQAREAESFVVSAVAGPVVAATYGLAQRLTKPLQLFALSMAQVVLPTSARAEVAERQVMLRQNVIATSVLTLACLALAPTLQLLVPLAFGARYAHAVPEAQIALMGAAVAAMSSPMASLLQGMGLQKATMRISVVSAVCTLTGVAVATPLGGAFGALAVVQVLLALKYGGLCALAASHLRRLARSGDRSAPASEPAGLDLVAEEEHVR